jgi:predicted transcriptional regulator
MVQLETTELEEDNDSRLYTDGGEDIELHQREQEPEGILYFTRYDSVPIMLDALFGAPTNREFTSQELANKANLNSRSVRDRIDILKNLGVVKQVGETTRYTLDLEGEITWKLRELDGLIKQAQGRSVPPRRIETGQDDTEAPQPPVGEMDEDVYDVMDSVREQAMRPSSHAD